MFVYVYCKFNVCFDMFIDVDVKPMEVDTSGTGSSNLSSVPQKLKKIKQFDLSSVVKPNSRGELEKMSVASFMRILEAESK